jgi:DNA polymerase elongation subunit (family B)
MGYTRPIATLDAETDPFSKTNAKRGYIPQPFIWGFYDAGFYESEKPFRYFERAEDFVNWIRDKEYVVYAHNGGKFDYNYLKQYVEPFDRVSFINGRLSRFNIGISEFRDSMNIFPTGLAAYKKQEFDYSILERTRRYRADNWARILEYLESDCVNLFEIVYAFRERFGPTLTQAAAAMRQWGKISSQDIPQTRFPKFYDRFKPYYFGGRVECFRVGLIEEPFKVVDINSAYPYAMLRRHPYSLTYSTRDGDARDELEYDHAGASFYRVRCRSRGAFPWKDPTGQYEDGALCFPVDDKPREYLISGHELQAAEETETVDDLEVVESFVFDTLTHFTAYVEHFYNERKKAKAEGDKAGDLFAKLMLNALYGRYAMNARRYNDYQVLPPDLIGVLHRDNEKEWKDKEGRVWNFAGYFGPNVLARSPIPEDKWRFYNVATAASVTGFVRAFLWRAICASDGVLYCDTDSIAAVNPVVDLGSELGQWDIEGSFSAGAIAGKKLYGFEYDEDTRIYDANGNRVRYKVASKGAKLSYAEVRKIARGETVRYMPEVPTYRISGFIDKATGKREIARYIPREIAMLPRNRKRLKSEV